MADEFTKAALYWIKTFNKKVKEKIWMMKLIELLNEYDSWWDYDDYYWTYQYWQDSDAYHLCKYQLVSKEYWFIKWLVENDKIDTESYCRITSIERKWEKDVYRDEVDSLLMLLAIQDELIDLLCSIVK